MPIPITMNFNDEQPKGGKVHFWTSEVQKSALSPLAS